jgi:hypothetical protein
VHQVGNKKIDMFIFSIKCTFVGENNFNIIKMHGTTIKFIDAQQAKLRNNYKNIKLKLQKTNAAIWFNKMCRIKHLKMANA